MMKQISHENIKRGQHDPKRDISLKEEALYGYIVKREETVFLIFYET